MSIRDPIVLCDKAYETESADSGEFGQLTKKTFRKTLSVHLF